MQKFVYIQMEQCKYFTPNKATHPEFAEALKKASECGVNIKAMNCNVTKDELIILKEVEIKLFKPLEDKKEHTGILEKYDENSIYIKIDEKQLQIERKNISLMKLKYNWD